MKLFCTEITTADGEKIAKAVLLQKKRAGYSLLQNYITEQENLKSLSGNYVTYFCIDYFDTIIETLSVPLVKDSKTFKLLAKSKLKDQLEEGTDYLMAYKADSRVQADKSGRVEHRVYIIPEKLFEEDSGLTEQQKLKMNLFTLSDFAIIGISRFYFPDDAVFHAFADEYKIMITVSRGNTIIYSRTLEYSDDGGSIESVFYESINLTYMFVTKNLRVDVDRMVLSGLLKDMTELSRMLFEFNHKQQSVIIHSRLISDCSRDIFHQFMIPISLCMLEDFYDFTPERYRVRRGFNLLKKGANIVALAAAAVLLFMNISALEKLGLAGEKLKSETKTVSRKLERNIRNFSDSDIRKFSFYYLKQIDENQFSAFDMYGDIAGLLETGGCDNVRFSTSEKVPEILVEGKVYLDSFKEVDTHRQQITSFLDQLRESGKYKVTDSSRYDMQGLVSYVKIKLEKVK